MRCQYRIVYVDHSTVKHGEVLSHARWSQEQRSPTQISRCSTHHGRTVARNKTARDFSVVSLGPRSSCPSNITGEESNPPSVPVLSPATRATSPFGPPSSHASFPHRHKEGAARTVKLSGSVQLKSLTTKKSCVAERNRAGLINRRSPDQNRPQLNAPLLLQNYVPV